MDLPIDNVDLRTIVAALEKSGENDLAAKLMLVSKLIEEGKAYKRILREEYGMVA